MKRVATRLDLLREMPKKMVMAELGVFEGTFSREIIRVCDPSELHLVDLWKRSRSPDSTNLRIKRLKRFGMWRAKRSIQREYKDDARVRIHQGFTTEVMSDFPDDYFDFVYVDASHKYENVKADLELSYSKVRAGGYICGHDYQYFVDGKDTLMHGGLRQAVDEFCAEKDLAIDILTSPGLTITDNSLSYCILNVKHYSGE